MASLRGENPVASLTLLTTLLDFADSGEIGCLVDEKAVQLREATIVEKADLKVGVVAIGSTVSIKGARNKEMKFKLVGSAEADPDLNRLSNESPIGRAVLGGKKGDKVDVVTPKGTVKYEITAISRV